MPATELIRARFDAAAEAYERFGAVQRRVAQHLAALTINGRHPTTGCEPFRIVEAGCGTGFLTELLCRRNPTAYVHALDFAPAMVQYCTQRLATDHPRLRCLCADVQEPEVWQSLAVAPIDWVISSLCLQWTNDWRATSSLWARHANWLMLSVPLQGSFEAWSHAHAQAGCEPGLYPLPARDELEQHLQGLGWLRHFDCEIETTYYDNALDFARHFQGLGAHQPRAGHRPVNLRRVLRHLPNGVAADYRIAYAVVECA